MGLNTDSCKEHISKAFTFKKEPGLFFFSCVFDPKFSVTFHVSRSLMLFFAEPC